MGHFLTDLHQIWFADRYWPYKGNWGPKIAIVGHVKMVAADILGLDFGHYVGLLQILFMDRHGLRVTGAQNNTFGKIQDGGDLDKI